MTERYISTLPINEDICGLVQKFLLLSTDNKEELWDACDAIMKLVKESQEQVDPKILVDFVFRRGQFADVPEGERWQMLANEFADFFSEIDGQHDHTPIWYEYWRGECPSFQDAFQMYLMVLDGKLNSSDWLGFWWFPWEMFTTLSLADQAKFLDRELNNSERDDAELVWKLASLFHQIFPKESLQGEWLHLFYPYRGDWSEKQGKKEFMPYWLEEETISGSNIRRRLTVDEVKYTVRAYWKYIRTLPPISEILYSCEDAKTDIDFCTLQHPWWEPKSLQARGRALAHMTEGSTPEQHNVSCQSCWDYFQKMSKEH